MKKHLILLTCVMLTACGGSKTAVEKSAAEEWSFTTVSFGESGGVVGDSRIFLMENNGKLLSIKEDGDVKALPNVGPRERLKVDSLSRAVWKLEPVRTSPGNINRRISIKRGEEERTFIWGKPGPQVPRLLETFHGYLMSLPTE